MNLTKPKEHFSISRSTLLNDGYLITHLSFSNPNRERLGIEVDESCRDGNILSITKGRNVWSRKLLQGEFDFGNGGRGWIAYL